LSRRLSCHALAGLGRPESPDGLHGCRDRSAAFVLERVGAIKQYRGSAKNSGGFLCVPCLFRILCHPGCPARSRLATTYARLYARMAASLFAPIRAIAA